MATKKERAAKQNVNKKGGTSGKNNAIKKLIRELADMLDETGLTQIEVEKNGLKVRVVREGQFLATPAAAAHAAATPDTAPPSPSEPEEKEDAGALLSPMVGTLFLSPEPGADPFCKVGDKVTKGQILLIIEAMKVMNPIPAPEAGTIKAILISDGEPVEFGQPMLVIE